MYPLLKPAEIDRLRRFGAPRAFAAAEVLVHSGERGHGLTLILSGEVEITQRREGGEPKLIVTHVPGSFMGELAQLSGQPALVTATATAPGEAIAIPPDRLRALLVGEAELGERIMRALILRRVGLLEIGVGGPVIIGREGDVDVLRLENFLERNGHPHQRLDPEGEADARTLLERFNVAPEELPIVLCPDGKLLRNPSEGSLAR